jgi:D-tyrosyl-tRNA(Tyr) deacylase
MRTVLQRVSSASVEIDGKIHAEIGTGYLILAGVAAEDGLEDAQWLAGKIARLRVLEDGEDWNERSLVEAGAECLVISQFTLLAGTKKGTKPSYHRAAAPAEARVLYEIFLREMEAALGQPVKSGVFGATMRVRLCNEGPVTILLDSKVRE